MPSASKPSYRAASLPVLKSSFGFTRPLGSFGGVGGFLPLALAAFDTTPSQIALSVLARAINLPTTVSSNPAKHRSSRPLKLFARFLSLRHFGSTPAGTTCLISSVHNARARSAGTFLMMTFIFFFDFCEIGLRWSMSSGYSISASTSKFSLLALYKTQSVYFCFSSPYLSQAFLQTAKFFLIFAISPFGIGLPFASAPGKPSGSCRV
mmetsp:Transcript_17127/g.51053  ORF Transcript_17127/g.51053 Transcript_17127/m.51053 type:complete len:208 (-) Transcript_17127:1271-1894(-)